MEKYKEIVAISIYTHSDEEKLSIGTALHKALVGNENYIHNRVILNIDTPWTIYVYIYNDCTDIEGILKTIEEALSGFSSIDQEFVKFAIDTFAQMDRSYTCKLVIDISLKIKNQKSINININELED